MIMVRLFSVNEFQNFLLNHIQVCFNHEYNNWQWVFYLWHRSEQRQHKCGVCVPVLHVTTFCL